MKTRKLDFVLRETSQYKIIFRFYPRSSSCHSFGDEPPKTWKEVYKVYYYYRIIKVWLDDNDHQVLFDSGCDECSIIDEVAHRIKLISEGITVYRGTTSMNEPFTLKLLDNECLPFGDGVSWIIHKIPRRKTYEFMLFDYKNVGYRFSLSDDKFSDFGKYLNECCEYMLAHGDPI